MSATSDRESDAMDPSQTDQTTMVGFNFEAAAERIRVAASALAADGLARLVEAWRDPTAWEGEPTVGELTLANAQWARVGYDELVLHGWDLAATILQTYEPGTEEFDVIEPFIEETGAEPAQRVCGDPRSMSNRPSPGSNDSSRCPAATRTGRAGAPPDRPSLRTIGPPYLDRVSPNAGSHRRYCQGSFPRSSAASPPYGNERHSDQRRDGIGQHFEDRDPGIGCVVVGPRWLRGDLRHPRSLPESGLSVSAACGAGCGSDPVAP